MLNAQKYIFTEKQKIEIEAARKANKKKKLKKVADIVPLKFWN